MPRLKQPISADDHVQGPASAPATLVEYGDYECPHCARAYPIVKRLQKRFGGNLRFVFRNFPLNESHPDAEAAAETAEFAATYGKFWEMHDLLFENQPRLGSELFVELAHKLKLPPQALETALKEGRFTNRVGTDFSGGARSGVNGTPTFFINEVRYDESWEYPELLLVIDQVIESARNPAAD